MEISVIICCHNPNRDLLIQVLNSLKQQTLNYNKWELIIIDNSSNVAIDSWLCLDWHPDYKIVIEKKLGLIHARIRGVKEAKYEILATVDDDTPLFPDYLHHIQSIYEKNPELGIIGGRSYPIYETPPPKFIDKFQSFLAIRDLGEEVILAKLGEKEKLSHYPTCAPILIAPKKVCMLAYLEYFKNNQMSEHLGRKGTSLSSGEDNDINLFIYKSGYTLGYFPELKFHHVIPAKRLTMSYLKKMAFESNRSWVKVLALHDINPWSRVSKYALALRYFKAYIANKAWRNPENYLKWKSACGLFKGLSEVQQNADA